jgi:lambda family phage portal protein
MRQVRGVPWFHAVLLEGKNLAVYKGGVLDSCKMMAMSGGFFTKTLEDGVPPPIGEEDEDGVEKEITVDFSPASFHIAPDGYKFEQFDPKQPTQNHAEYVKLLEGEIAAGLDVPYFDLTGDLSNVNYSSARVGQADERDVWRDLQDFVAGVFCREVYHSWVRSSMLTGALRLTNREYVEVQNPSWRPRGWRYVDPQKEISANVEALANKLTTWTDVLGEQGIDINDHFETLKQEQELAASLGIDLSIASKTAPPPANDSTDEKTGDNKPPADAGRGFTNGLHSEGFEN